MSFKNDLDNIGFAYIAEKKENIEDSKVYYEILDFDCGFVCDYKNEGLLFTSLYRKIGHAYELSNRPKNKFSAFGFKSLEQLCLENDNTMNINFFLEKIKSKIIGEIFYYDSYDELQRVTDENLILEIKNINRDKKDFDENVLNKDSSISQMYNEIKKTIISQDEQIMKILTTLFKNQQVVNGKFDIDLISKLKENILIYGSTGTGKTEILKRIAKIYDVPIVIEDATSFTESGYVGRDIKDMLNDLYLASGKNIKKAEKGILVIDEFDKLSEKESTRSHASRDGVQRSLLKLLEGSEFYFDGLTFNTSKLSVVALGAFTGISKNDDYSDITISNFVEYGIMRELMGRFSKLVPMNRLTKDDIKKILVESNFSPLNTYKQLFDTMNIEFTYEEDFIDYVAEKAVELNSGARSLKTVFDDMISSAMFRIFAGDYSKIHLSKPNEDEKPYVLTKKK